MEIIECLENDKLTLSLDGRLDALAALELDAKIKANAPKIKELVFDFAKVPYIASAGIRVVVQAQKLMSAQGAMKLINVPPAVREVFEITKLIKLLKIE